MVVHQWHPADTRSSGHLGGILRFAQLHGSSCDCTILAGDFNEDARVSERPAAQVLTTNYTSPDRTLCGLPAGSLVGRSLVKADWVWLRGARAEYDRACIEAVTMSHRKCGETGQWPSDHGLEAVRAVISDPAPGPSLLQGSCAIGYALDHSEGEGDNLPGRRWIARWGWYILAEEVVCLSP